jgi:hypothetical protein
VTTLDAVKDIRSGLGSPPVVLAIHTFAFEHSKKLSTAALSAQLSAALMLPIT